MRWFSALSIRSKLMAIFMASIFISIALIIGKALG